MQKIELKNILRKCYGETIDLETAWIVYNNIVELCQSQDVETIFYLLETVGMNQKQRLLWRNRLAEKGFELTPEQVNQYLLVITLGIESGTKL